MKMRLSRVRLGRSHAIEEKPLMQPERMAGIFAKGDIKVLAKSARVVAERSRLSKTRGV
jgi:hypothetical protein